LILLQLQSAIRYGAVSSSNTNLFVNNSLWRHLFSFRWKRSGFFKQNSTFYYSISCLFYYVIKWLNHVDIAIVCLLLLFVYWCCVMLHVWWNKVFIVHSCLAYNYHVHQFDYLLQVLFNSAYTTVKQAQMHFTKHNLLKMFTAY